MDKGRIPDSTASTISDSTEYGVPVQRKRPASQHPDAIRDRKKKWRETGNTRRGKVEFSFTRDEEKKELFAKISKAKCKIGGTTGMVSTYNMLNHVLDYFLEPHDSKINNAQTTEDMHNPEIPAPTSYQYISKEDSSDEDSLFICHFSAIDNLLSRVKYHDISCTSSLKAVKTERQ